MSDQSLKPMTADEHAKLRKLRSLRNAKDGYLFLLPWLFGFAAFVAFPLLFSLFLSFHKVGIRPDGAGFSYKFIGLENFTYAFLVDNVFPIDMINFILEAILVVPVTVIFAFLIAILLNQQFYGRFLFRTIFFLPVIFASGEVIKELFAQGQGKAPLELYNVQGMIADVLPATLVEPLLGVLGKLILIFWFSGVQIVIFIAAFQTIPVSTYEAARIDGATPWEIFWKITFPAVTPFILLTFVYTTIDLSSNPFNPILAHFKGNMLKPETGYGYVSAIGWIYSAILFLLVIVFILPASRLYRKKVRR
ncbi:sugar ABC transporter permease [Paenibacillus sp.]|uniref:carbohydrate ABC transporter permease n=1 Tax=Paenibacillus sp. TaxID=58172 RepID=UPI002810C29B|nr:sugar ABC transporter permease [Paenibacillus sp.]